MLLIAIAGVVRARRRHRALLALVAHGDPDVPGTLVVDHPAAAAYCVPGIRSQVVVSAGTLALLGPYELAAVLAHERAHARERHDLVLLPFTSLRRILPQSADRRPHPRRGRAAHRDGGRRPRPRHRPAKELATASAALRLRRRRAHAGRHAGRAGAEQNSPVLVRVRRLMAPAPLARPLRGVMLAGATAGRRTPADPLRDPRLITPPR